VKPFYVLTVAGWYLRRGWEGGSSILTIAVGWRHFGLADKVKPSVSVDAERRYHRMSRTRAQPELHRLMQQATELLIYSNCITATAAVSLYASAGSVW
jgi:hypothetical protein